MGVTKSIVYFTKVKERYSLNNAKVLECSEPRGNSKHIKERVTGNLVCDTSLRT